MKCSDAKLRVKSGARLSGEKKPDPSTLAATKQNPPKVEMTKFTPQKL